MPNGDDCLIQNYLDMERKSLYKCIGQELHAEEI